jgi:hypothetical protein
MIYFLSTEKGNPRFCATTTTTTTTDDTIGNDVAAAHVRACSSPSRDLAPLSRDPIDHFYHVVDALLIARGGGSAIIRPPSHSARRIDVRRIPRQDVPPGSDDRPQEDAGVVGTLEGGRAKV